MFIERIIKGNQEEELIEIVIPKVSSATGIRRIKVETKEQFDYSDKIECRFFWWSTRECIRCTFRDFSVEIVTENPAYDRVKYEITKCYWEFMYSKFGEEYKKAYIINKSRRFNKK